MRSGLKTSNFSQVFIHIAYILKKNLRRLNVVRTITIWWSDPAEFQLRHRKQGSQNLIHLEKTKTPNRFVTSVLIMSCVTFYVRSWKFLLDMLSAGVEIVSHVVRPVGRNSHNIWTRPTSIMKRIWRWTQNWCWQFTFRKIINILCVLLFLMFEMFARITLDTTINLGLNRKFI